MPSVDILTRHVGYTLFFATVEITSKYLESTDL